MKSVSPFPRMAVSLLFVLVLLPNTRSATIYVNQAATAVPDGATWPTAWKTVQEAVNAAQAGDEIWVAAAVYKETVTLKDGVALYGGFRGDETERAARSFAANVTILDGEKKRTVVIAPAGITQSAVLDGFTLQNGLSVTTQGVAIQAVDAGPTIRNNTITSNTYAACAVYLKGAVSAVFEGNTVTANLFSKQSGGPTSGTALIVENSAATVRNNVLQSNKGAGIKLTNATSSVTGNTIRLHGNGIVISGGSPSIRENDIQENSAGTGGGIWCSNASPVIERNLIRGNGASTYGGGIYTTGGAPLIRDNVIAGNFGTSSDWRSPSYGAGIYCVVSGAGVPVIANNTLIGNNNGGALNFTGTKVPVIVNNLVAYNSSAGFSPSSSRSSIRNNCIWDSPAGGNTPPGPDTFGNIKKDPKLANYTSGDYRLQPDSSCRDAGDDAVLAAGETDKDGQARLQGAHADIGAFETDGTQWATPSRIVRVRPDGDDANDGSAWDRSMKTVTAATDGVRRAGGGEVWVAAGTYAGKISLGTYCAMYGGFAGTETTLDQRLPEASETILTGDPTSDHVQVRPGAAAAVVDGFTFTGAVVLPNGNAINGVAVLGYAQARVSRNRFQIASGIGVLGLGYSSVSVWANRFRGEYQAVEMMPNSTADLDRNIVLACSLGIRMQGGSGTVRNNVVAGCWDQAVAVTDGPTVALTNNTIIGCGQAVYVSGDNTVASFANNIIAFNEIAVYNDALHAPTFKFNCFYSNGQSDFQGMASPIGSSGNFRGDPLISGFPYGGWRLSANSPCVNVGDDTAAASSVLDAEGEPRKTGLHVDIGADEVAGAPAPFIPRVVRVSPEGDDSHDGATWAAAKRSVGAAMSALTTMDGGGEVWVAAGTYQERLSLPVFVHLYGGFSGTEDMRDQRSVGAAKTVLDGQGGGTVVSITTVGPYGTFDGFEVTNRPPTATVTAPSLICWGSSILIANNSFPGQPHPYGFGGVTLGNGAPKFTNNVVTGSGFTRAALFCEGSSAEITGNVIQRSTGNGLEASGGSVKIRENLITDNANYGIMAYGGMTIDRNTITRNAYGGFYANMALGPCTITNNVFAGNTGGTGPAINSWSTPMTVLNNTIVGNTFLQGNPEHGVVHFAESTVTMANNIVAFNASGVVNDATYPAVLTMSRNDLFGNAAFDYAGMTDPFAGGANITADPLFLNHSGGDYHLTSGSPCINAGTTAAYGALDMNGNPRVAQNVVDMGAYEWTGPPADTAREIVQVLRIAGGLASASVGDVSLLDVEPNGSLDVFDAIRLARKVAGLETIP